MIEDILIIKHSTMYRVIGVSSQMQHLLRALSKKIHIQHLGIAVQFLIIIGNIGDPSIRS